MTDDYIGMVLRSVRPLTPEVIERIAAATGLTTQIVRAACIWARALQGENEATS